MNKNTEKLEEIQPDRVSDRLKEAEDALKNKKVKLPKDVFKRAEEGLRKINEKLEKRLPIYESDFDFIEELKDAIKIAQQYNEAIKSLKGGDLYNPEKPIEGDKKAPTMEEAINTLQAKLTKEQKEVIDQMKNPVLLVKPITTWKRFAENLNSAKKIGYNNRGSEWTENEKDAKITDKITGWEVGFVEGELELEGKPGAVGELIAEWQIGHQSKKGAKLATNNEYMLLVARSIKKGTPIDKQSFSVLRGEGREEIIGKDGRVSSGARNGGAPDFGDYSPERRYAAARFRVAVMVKI
ncbi:MAG: hypothetical protein WCT53_05660 [Candidatus Gracilibacteria bacterium]